MSDIRWMDCSSIPGIDYDEILSDPQLGGKRRQFVESKAKQLASARMIVFNSDTSTFSITDLGRIAAKFYIRTKTVEIFNEFFKPNMKEADLLGLLSKSTEVAIVCHSNELLPLKLCNSLNKSNYGRARCLN